MKNLTMTKKLNNCIALVVMMALLVTSIGVLPSKAVGTFTVSTSPCTVEINSFSKAKDYITVKDGDTVLQENVDYNYGSDPLKSTTTMITNSGGFHIWTGTVYGIGDYSGYEASAALSYTVSVSSTAPTVPTAPTTPTTPTVTTPVDTSTTTPAPADSTTTATPTTEASTGTEKSIEGKVTFKKFMEKYCNYGVFPYGDFFSKDFSGKYTIGKTSNTPSQYGPMGHYPCSPKYQGTASFSNKKFGTWKEWDAGDDYMSNSALPARLWKKYTADGDADAINCMLDDFEKLPASEKQLHIGNFTYGQILKSAEKVGRTVKVEVLPLKKKNNSMGYGKLCYGYNVYYEDVGCPNGSGVRIGYSKTRVNHYAYSNIDSALRCLNKFEVQWKCKGETAWRKGNCGVIVADTMSSTSGKPMGKGDVYSVRGNQSYLWSNVTTIRIRQYRTINGTNYYTDWLTVYKNGKEVNKSKTATTSSKTKVKNKTIKKGKKVKVKVAYTKKQKIKWTVSNKKVVKFVKKSGKGYNTITIKGKKVGKATITGKGKGKTFKIKVTVKK